MKKLFLIFISTFLFVFLFSKEILIKENTDKPVFQTLQSDNNKTVIQFNLDKYKLSDIKENGKNYKKIDYDTLEGEQYEVGKPFIPSIGGFVAIPSDCNPKINIVSYQTEVMKNILLYPRQSDNANKKAFEIDENFYSKDTDFPNLIAQLGSPVILRDYRLSALKITPFQYNPKKKILTVYKNIKIQVDYVKTSDSINNKISRKKHSRFFEKIYKNTIINYDFVKSCDNDFQQPAMLIIYANNSNLATLVNYFAEWKKQKGFDVTTISTAQTGTNFNSIKAYIQDAYDNWENPPEYLILIGDANTGGYYIPTSTYDDGAGDIAYTLLEGNDILGDMFVGRLSVSTQTEMQTVLQKIFKYEKEPYMSQTDWYKKASLIGDPSQSGQSTIYTNLYIKQLISDTNPDYSFYEAYNGGYTSTMSNSINSGVLYFNYRGWYGMSGWDNSYTNSLSNGYKLPMVVAITCGTGDFDDPSADAINEVFLTAGTPSNPKGGIAAISTATIHTHTCFNNLVDAGFYQAVFKEDITTPGAALTRAKYALYLAYPQNPAGHVTQFSYWNNLMGDPSIELWTNQPQTLNMDYPQTISYGTKYITATCTDQNQLPLKNVWVTAYKSDSQIFATGFTDEDGKILLNINANVSGTIKLTATKHNFIPVLGEIIVQSQSQNLAMEQFEIDDSSGNNDGNINPGENINLNIHLKNWGTETATNVNAVISSESDKVNILNDNVSYPDIQPNQVAASNTSFQIQFDANIADYEKIPFKIDITNGGQTHSDYFELDIKSALFIVENYTLSGDANGVLDPGETDNMYLQIKNLGSITAENVTGILSSNSSKITVEDADGNFGNVPPNNSVTNISNQFTITADTNLIPGTVIPLELTLNTQSGFQQILYVNIQIGQQSITDPVGPDEFGHFIYDDNDVAYSEVPTYEWIEIDPSQGGGGTLLNLNDNGGASDIETVDLPIDFRFYGKDYSRLTICSDGWVSPGEHNQPAFMNWPIPGPLAPQPLIAAFWDDLKSSGNTAKIIYKYDSVNSIFIVEWSNLKQQSNNANETFEVILYDATVYPTSTLDSKIKIQYKDIHNVDGGSYGGYEVTHGQYSTVGIQDENGLQGLQYTFNNTYPTAAKPIENNMALMISGGNFSLEEPLPVLANTEFENDDNHNGQPDFGEHLDMYLNLHNLGENPATNVTVNITTDDEYITLYNNASNYNDVDNTQNQRNLQPFTMYIDSNVPDGHIAVFAVTINSDQGSWQYNANVRLNALDLQITSIGIANDDNNNGLLEAGENGDVILYLSNNGAAPETNLHFIASTSSNAITINQTNFDLSHIYGNGEFAIVYNVSVSPSATVNQIVPITFDVSGNYNYSQSLQYNLRIGSTTEDFETGDFSSFDWQFSSNPWIIDSTNHHSGNYSARSSDIDDLEFATIQIEVNLSQPSSVSFYRKVSCEDDGNNGYDRLEFWIDNTEKDRWGGERAWQQYSYSVPAGTHTLKWIYRKDTYVSEGQDCAWIDDISLPGVANAIENPQMMISYESFDEFLGVNQTVSDTIDITNIGASVLAYQAQLQNASADFLSLENTAGTLLCGETGHLILNFSSMGLEEGEYSAQIYIVDNRAQTIIPVTLTVSSVANSPNNIPVANKLYPSYPNPYFAQKQKSGVKIKFALKKQSQVDLKIYNIKGQLVRKLIRKDMKAGVHTVVWDTRDQSGKKVSSGLYLYKIQADKFNKINKMIIIK